jgi:D-alanyl-D-alanine carboxypeptidase
VLLVPIALPRVGSPRIEDGHDEWGAQAGTNQVGSSIPAAVSSRFRIGSVTKTFVATVVLQLVDEGRLALDDPLARHLPGIVPNGTAITVRQILNHTSGLFDYAHEPGWSTRSRPAMDAVLGILATAYCSPRPR